MKYIIMCGGRYRWNPPKQMTKIHGEPIVARTIRLLRINGIDDIAISANDDRFSAFNVPILTHRNTFDADGDGSWAEAFYPTYEPVCYIMGDVVFSPEAIKRIVTEETDSIQFFASSPPFDPRYIKLWAEPFAFKVVSQQRFRAAVEYVITNEASGVFRRRPIAWELWQVINGENVNTINYSNYVAINDYTCDIDDPRDAEKFEMVVPCGS